MRLARLQQNEVQHNVQALSKGKNYIVKLGRGVTTDKHRKRGISLSRSLPKHKESAELEYYAISSEKVNMANYQSGQSAQKQLEKQPLQKSYLNSRLQLVRRDGSVQQCAGYKLATKRIAGQYQRQQLLNNEGKTTFFKRKNTQTLANGNLNYVSEGNRNQKFISSRNSAQQPFARQSAYRIQMNDGINQQQVKPNLQYKALKTQSRYITSHPLYQSSPNKKSQKSQTEGLISSMVQARIAADNTKQLPLRFITACVNLQKEHLKTKDNSQERTSHLNKNGQDPYNLRQIRQNNQGILNFKPPQPNPSRQQHKLGRQTANAITFNNCSTKKSLWDANKTQSIASSYYSVEVEQIRLRQASLVRNYFNPADNTFQYD